jgi:(2Fe-2S) ferredoxin
MNVSSRTEPGSAARMADDSYYRYHVFFCVNQREPGGKECCADKNAMAMRDHAKRRIKELGLHGRGGIRINQAGCLDRCADGPTMVVYPEGIWYTYVDAQDVDEIIDQHLREGRVVERLRI